MRRVFIAIAAVVVALPLAFTGAASAAPAKTQYTLLNETGLKQALIKKPLAPRWFGNPSGSAFGSSDGARPLQTAGQQRLRGEKSVGWVSSTIFYPVTGRSGKLVSIVNEIFQYSDVQTTLFAWQGFTAQLSGLAGTWEHTLRDSKGKVVGTSTVVVTVSKGESIYGADSWIVKSDVVVDDSTPASALAEDSMDTIDVWATNGAAITHVAIGKFVNKVRNWCLSQGETNTAPVLAQLLTQRYHHSAVKAL